MTSPTAFPLEVDDNERDVLLQQQSQQPQPQRRWGNTRSILLAAGLATVFLTLLSVYFDADYAHLGVGKYHVKNTNATVSSSDSVGNTSNSRSSEHHDTKSRPLYLNVSDPITYLPAYLQNPETQQPMTYSWTNTKPTRPLKFLHIPKTGGSTIENAATLGNQTWGLCMFLDTFGAIHCPPKGIAKRTNVAFQPALRKEVAGISLWHTPLQYLPVDFAGSVNYNVNITNPYQDSDIFVVMRNPYKRAVSRECQKCFLYIHPSLCYRFSPMPFPYIFRILLLLCL